MTHINALAGILTVLCMTTACRGAVMDTVDSDIVAGDSVVWSADTVLLTGTVYVDSGAVLTIEPGVVVKVRELNESEGGPVFLIVSRHARIRAEGTADAPIVFTAEADDFSVSRTVAVETTGLWGGVAILGAAPTNLAETEREYWPVSFDGEPRLRYGGDDPGHSSGALRYVTIRFAGQHFQDVAEEEDSWADEVTPAGLALCCVGSGTSIEYVEVYASADDAIRLVGGTVDCRYLCGVFSRESAFDFERGYRGTCQYLLAVHGERFTPTAMHQAGEPVIANATYVSSGLSYPTAHEGQASGPYFNSIFYHGVGPTVDAWAMSNVTSGAIRWRGCIYGKAASYDYPWDEFMHDDLWDYIPPYNSLGDPGFLAFSANWGSPHPNFDLRPADSIAIDSVHLTDSTDGRVSRLDQVCYKGAFDPTAAQQWTEEWTSLEHYTWLIKNMEAPFDSLPRCYDKVRVTRSAQTRKQAPLVRVHDGALVLNTDFGHPIRVSVSVFDLGGRRVIQVQGREVRAGARTTHFGLDGLRKGAYVCVISVGGTTFQTLPLLIR